MFDIIIWIGVGILATLVMSIFQLVFLGFFGKKSIPEFDQNAHLLLKATGKEWEDTYWYGFILHFAHGVLGAIFFGIVIEFNILEAGLFSGILYGLLLWIVLLIIHKPITGENIVKTLPNSQIISSFISHVLYGVGLNIIVNFL